jgi:hypothetical protein
MRFRRYVVAVASMSLFVDVMGSLPVEQRDKMITVTEKKQEQPNEDTTGYKYFHEPGYAIQVIWSLAKLN